MLPQQFRLTRTRDFEILFKEGQFFAAPLLQFKIWKVDPGKYPKRDYTTSDLKIGFVVSTKVSKSAVVRNRVKRQMREVVRLLLKQSRFPVGFMLAFIAKPAMVGKDYKEIEENILSVLKKSGILL